MFEVGIVGAGVHGAAAAFHLASRGVSTVVFERGTPASGPTGCSSAVCRAYYTNEFLAATAQESIDMLEGFEELTGREAGFRRTGFLYLHPPEDTERLTQAVGRLNAIGVRTDLVGVDDLGAAFPVFRLDDVGMGVWEPGAGYADPTRTTLALFDRAVELGAVARLGRTVRPIQLRGDGAAIVDDTGASVACDRVLIAAGPWSRPLASAVGASVPLSVERHVVARFGYDATEPVPPHADLFHGYYAKPDGDDFTVGSLHAAETVDPDAYADQITDSEVDDFADVLDDLTFRGGFPLGVVVLRRRAEPSEPLTVVEHKLDH